MVEAGPAVALPPEPPPPPPGLFRTASVPRGGKAYAPALRRCSSEYENTSTESSSMPASPVGAPGDLDFSGIQRESGMADSCAGQYFSPDGYGGIEACGARDMTGSVSITLPLLRLNSFGRSKTAPLSPPGRGRRVRKAYAQPRRAGGRAGGAGVQRDASEDEKRVSIVVSRSSQEGDKNGDGYEKAPRRRVGFTQDNDYGGSGSGSGAELYTDEEMTPSEFAEVRAEALELLTAKHVYHDTSTFKNLKTRVVTLLGQRKLLEFFLSFAFLLFAGIDFFLFGLRISYLPRPAEGSFPQGLEHSLDALHIVFLFLHLLAPAMFAGNVYSAFLKRYKSRDMFIDIVAAVPTSVIAWVWFRGNPLWRINKLFLLLTTPRRFGSVIDRLSLEFQLSPLIIRLIRHICLFILIAHWTSCVWYLTVKADLDDPEKPSLLPLLGIESSTSWVAHDPDLWRLYCLGFDWALKYLCGYGVIGPFPHSDRQVVLMLVVAMMGICMYATFLGVVSTIVSEAATNGPVARLRAKLDEVTDALNSVKMPTSFTDETKKYYRHVFSHAGTVGTSDILNDLPNNLLDRVNCVIARDVVHSVPMFRDISDEWVLQSLMELLTPKIFLPMIPLVSIGDYGAEMIFVQRGELAVLDADGQTVRVLSPGSYYGEQALLGSVVRQTSVQTLSSVLILVLSKFDFQKLVEIVPVLGWHMEDFLEKRKALRESGEDAFLDDDNVSIVSDQSGTDGLGMSGISGGGGPARRLSFVSRGSLPRDRTLSSARKLSYRRSKSASVTSRRSFGAASLGSSLGRRASTGAMSMGAEPVVPFAGSRHDTSRGGAGTESQSTDDFDRDNPEYKSDGKASSTPSSPSSSPQQRTLGVGKPPQLRSPSGRLQLRKSQQQLSDLLQGGDDQTGGFLFGGGGGGGEGKMKRTASIHSLGSHSSVHSLKGLAVKAVGKDRRTSVLPKNSGKAPHRDPKQRSNSDEHLNTSARSDRRYSTRSNVSTSSVSPPPDSLSLSLGGPVPHDRRLSTLSTSHSNSDRRHSCVSNSSHASARSMRGNSKRPRPPRINAGGGDRDNPPPPQEDQCSVDELTTGSRNSLEDLLDDE
eukprot:TRINITY_DN8412_c0_g1_i1.p1 TRINITY_DN8412_c0_g1~~TRINITY_DN8412_c0_g1_i1.p1  ORF type:complete len:1092 (+),score=353.92 TRINITY_DN8412_c0_g1_i1:166-3441(+)